MPVFEAVPIALGIFSALFSNLEDYSIYISSTLELLIVHITAQAIFIRKLFLAFAAKDFLTMWNLH